MEAVPRLPMISFELKSSPEATSFLNLKRYIAECYQEDPESYSKEVHNFESLRNSAIRPIHDVTGCAIMKRYYCQLNSLQSRFPLLSERQIFSFSWRDMYSNSISQTNDVKFEMAAILYNIASLHTQLGSTEARTSPDGMKLACTHFQCAAWAFGQVKEMSNHTFSSDMSPEVLIFMEQLCFAQAQECILEKSLADNRKAAIVAKVTAQIVTYYNSALAALLAGGEDGTVSEILGNKFFKEWKRYVKFKISYLSAILFLYQGQQSEEMQKMGERVTLYQAAFDKLEEAKKESKGMSSIEQINETITFTLDVIEAKRKAAKNENEFIYHEEVPDLATLSAVKGANLVNGTSFSVTDPEVAGEDIFHRLVPMKAHEASSLYSEEKAKLLRKYAAKIEDRDTELNNFMGSLKVESLNFDQSNNPKLPQGLVDRCAALNSKPNSIPDLVSSMSNLAVTCTEVESMLQEIKELLLEEDSREKNYQQTMGARPSGHFAELTREFQKYQEAHSKAGESNETLRKAMGLHVSNLKTLAQPLSEIQKLVPVIRDKLENDDLKQLQVLMSKVNEMRMQRAHFYTTLRESATNDDITAQVVAWGDKKLDKLFKKELSKHDKTVTVLEQNLTAQGNILKALTECYAKCAPLIKALIDTKHKREQFFSSLAASYDVYEDLLGKSAKGLEFYKKLQGNVHKLLARVRAARDVQDEERQQRLKSTKAPTSVVSEKSHGPKLKDYLKSGAVISSKNTNANITSTDSTASNYLPTIRPSPLGSETTPVSNCVRSATSDKYFSQNTSQQMYEPQSVYPSYPSPSNYNNSMPSYCATNQQAEYGNSLDNTQQYYLPNQSQQTGYTNPIYQNQVYSNIANLSSAMLPPNTVDSATPYSYNPVATTIIQSNKQPVSSVYPQQQQQYQSDQSYAQMNVQQTLQQPTSVASNYPTSITPNSNSYYPDQNQAYNYQPNENVNQTSQVYPSQQNYASQPQVQSEVPQYLNSNETITTNWQDPNSNLNQQFDNMSIQNYSYALPTDYTQQQQPQMQPQQKLQENNYYGANDSIPSNINQYVQQNQITIPQSDTNYRPEANMLEQQQINYATGYAQPNQYNQQMNYDNQNNSQVANFSQTSSYASHPGYTYNQMTGEYNYGSGYQVDSGTGSQKSYISQYTRADSNPNDNTTLSTQINPGQQLPTSSETQNVQYNAQQQLQQIHQYNNAETQNITSTTATTGLQQNEYQHPVVQPQIEQQQVQQPQIQQPQVQQPQIQQPQVQQPQVHQPQVQQPIQEQQKNESQIINSQPNKIETSNSNLDLLSGIDFSTTFTPPALTIPILQPESTNLQEDKKTQILVPENIDLKKITNTVDKMQSSATGQQIMTSSTSSIQFDRKSSIDNLSVCSDLSSLDANFDWESASLKNVNENFNDKDVFDNPNLLKWLHKEVERLEKFMETLNVKTLNGTTPLDSKWKEIQDLLVKDESKRTTVVAKLFPEKNRSTDCIPYDHARVLLPTVTDDYINASYVRDLGTGAPVFILTQTPMTNTIKDFWCMVWSQNSKILVCLHTPSEILDTFWPQQLNQEMVYGDYSIVLERQFDLSHCIELSLKLTMHNSDIVMNITLLQIKQWIKNSTANIIGITNNIISTYKQLLLQNNESYMNNNNNIKGSYKIIINCLTGNERSGLLSLSITAILGTQVKRPILINVVDVWFRICSQRKSALRDTNTLQLSYQIVLSYAHELLNKRGIMTSYQMMKTAQTVTATEKEEKNDPFSDIDPLWKLKSK